MSYKKIILFTLIFMFTLVNAQNYWQQKVDYTMVVDLDVKTHRYKGTQKLVYTNNSPDELDKVFYHLYYNAFQPNSQMDARLKSIADPDGRMMDADGKTRIENLALNEIGNIKVTSLKQNGKKLSYKVVGTVLEVTLDAPIKSGKKATFEMEYDAKIPLQIRRTGRSNAEGIAYSMTQWYPKMAEYDFEGWHTSPYISREFHGVWGDFDVTIFIDKRFVLGGTGALQNPQEIGHGYENKNKKLNLPNCQKLKWHFKGNNIHDFAWAADPLYKHDTYTMKNGVKLHFLYKENLDSIYLEGWKKLQPKTAELMEYYSKNVGQYPYKQYSVIQGGDGGMEYAQCTLITGKRKLSSLFGVTAHELAHTWFQFLLATNESKHPWMDEGFTTYISNKAVNDILKENKDNPHVGSYNGYNHVVTEKIEEPLCTHADRFNLNTAYGIASYSKGNIFLSQLEYIIGKENVAKTLKEYFKQFSFKHPTPNDFKRVAEKVSGIHLDWYLNEWTQTTHTIHYGIESVTGNVVTLKRIGKMPMPIDVEIRYTDGSKEDFNIPLEMMRANKPTKATILKDWGWAYPTYTFKTKKEVKSVKIDKSGLMADMNPNN